MLWNPQPTLIQCRIVHAKHIGYPMVPQHRQPCTIAATHVARRVGFQGFTDRRNHVQGGLLCWAVALPGLADNWRDIGPPRRPK